MPVNSLFKICGIFDKCVPMFWCCLNDSDANLSLGSTSGIVIAVPIAKEHAASGAEVEKAIQYALQEAR